MNWLTQLFTQSSIVHDILIYSIIIALGLAFGRIRFFGVSLGITWVLFIAILFANLGLTVDPNTDHFLKEFGLALFVYCIGLQVGPSFFNSLKKEGLQVNLLALLVVVIGVVLSICFYLFSSNNISIVAGLMSGAVTNTPGLGAAQAVMSDPDLAQKGLNASEASIAYAVTYPFGVVGIVVVLLFLKKIWKIDIQKEQETYDKTVESNPNKPVAINLKLTNPMLFDKPLSSVYNIIPDNFIVSRMYHNNIIMAPTDDIVLKNGDVLLVVAPRQITEKLKMVIGDESRLNLQEVPGNLIKRNIVVTRKKATFKELEDTKELTRTDCQITRVDRSGFELIPAPDFVLRIGDLVTVVGTEEGIKAFTEFLGNSVKKLETPELAPIFFGLFLGIILGSIPFTISRIPVPVKIGLAGGPLIIALIISQFGNIARIYNYTTYSANLMVRELGIVLFLASIGLSTGSDFIAIFKTGKGFEWMGIGAIITVVPLIVTALVARYVAKKSFFEIGGLLSGASTDPPALAFTLQMAGNNVPSLTYATVYPLTMIARILAAELLILGFM